MAFDVAAVKGVSSFKYVKGKDKLADLAEKYLGLAKGTLKNLDGMGQKNIQALKVLVGLMEREKGLGKLSLLVQGKVTDDIKLKDLLGKIVAKDSFKNSKYINKNTGDRFDGDITVFKNTINEVLGSKPVTP